MPATTGPAVTSTTITRDTCTEADLERPLDQGMPASQVVTHRLVIEQGSAYLDPSGSVTPRVSAPAAWQTLTKGQRGGGRSQLMLGYVTSTGPKEDHLLAWVLEVHHVASDARPDGVSLPLGGVTGLTAPVTAPPPPCVFGGSYVVLDATTGRELWGASGPEELLFVPQNVPFRAAG